jgi:hypothetical protein
MAKDTYTERQSMDDAKGIAENIFHRREMLNVTREELAAFLRQIVKRELKK